MARNSPRIDELKLCDLLRDPLIQLVMEADGIDVQDFLRLLPPLIRAKLEEIASSPAEAALIHAPLRPKED